MSNPYINLGIKCAQFSTGVSSNLNISKPGTTYKPAPSINTDANFGTPPKPVVSMGALSSNKPSLGMSHYRADLPPDTSNPLIRSYMAANPNWTPPKQPADLTRTSAADYRKNLLSQQYGAQNVQASKDLGNPMGPNSLRGADNYARDWTKSPGHFAAQGYSSHSPWQYR